MSRKSIPLEHMEILAPAGSPESLAAAVRAGADAVYLGADSFSARASAHNFDSQALREAVRYCHARGVRVHLALNTLLLEDELPRAVELARYACTLPVDAVLVQDPGLLLRLRACAPQLPLHASTQMSLHTPAGARAAEEAGCTRAVLAREMSLEEIRQVRGAVSLELESFVHGALCMSVSGQCYFSAMLGSRSGNRGMCAQTCRLPFSGPGGTGHDLSLKDLSLISRLGDLAAAGVCSAKIEGRMKRPEYVAAAVTACRRQADGDAPPPRLLENLESVFSRSGFTAGFADGGSPGRAMFGVRSREDVAAATPALFGELHALYKDEYPRVPVSFSLTAEAGRPLRLEASDGEGRLAQAEGDPPEPARTRPVDEARCREQLAKTGGTPFRPAEIRCQVGEGLAFPVSQLNRLRRQVLDSLLEQRAERPAIPFQQVPFSPAPHAAAPGPLPLRIRVTGHRLPEGAAQCQLVYVPYDTPPEQLARWREEGVRAALELPRGMFGLEPRVRRALEQAGEAGFRECWAGNLGAAQLAKECGFTVHGGFSLNITNTAALEFYREFGLADAELSFELTLAQAAGLGGPLPRGTLLYGRQPLMLTRACPAANGPKGCLRCRESGRFPSLTDRKGKQFPVQCYGACSEVLNALPLELSDRLGEVRGMDFGVLRFSVESLEEQAAVLRRYRQGLPPAGEFTRGLSYRGVGGPPAGRR